MKCSFCSIRPCLLSAYTKHQLSSVLLYCILCVFLLMPCPIFAVSPSQQLLLVEQTEQSRVYKQKAQTVRKQATGHKKSTPKNSVQTQKPQLKTGATTQRAGAKAWSFGHGKSAADWQHLGIDGDDLSKRAGAKKKQAKKQKTTQKDSGIKVSVKKESQDWGSTPSVEQHPGEFVPFESQHRVRAFAGVREDNVSIGIGPEVILRENQQVRKNIARSDRPDVDTGVGMQFSIDF